MATERTSHPATGTGCAPASGAKRRNGWRVRRVRLQRAEKTPLHLRRLMASHHDIIPTGALSLRPSHIGKRRRHQRTTRTCCLAARRGPSRGHFDSRGECRGRLDLSVAGRRGRSGIDRPGTDRRRQGPGNRKDVHGPHPRRPGRAGAPFENGKLVERPDDSRVTRKSPITPIHRS